jgi:hypothetical protein
VLRVLLRLLARPTAAGAAPPEDIVEGFLVEIPHALPPILQMLIAGQFRFMLLRGSKFRYRSAWLISLRLEMKTTCRRRTSLVPGIIAE